LQAAKECSSSTERHKLCVRAATNFGRQSGGNALGASGEYVLVVDGDTASCDLVAARLQDAGIAARTAPTGAEALASARSERPALVLLEVSLPDIGGFELCHELRDEFGEGLPIIFLSGSRTEPLDRAAGLLIGGDDYIVKPADPSELLARVRRPLVRAGGSKAARRSATSPSLSPREQQVLELLAEGALPGQIAVELAISPKTVASHIQRVLSKLNVHSRAQAVAVAYRDGLIEHASHLPTGRPAAWRSAVDLLLTQLVVAAGNVLPLA
jgi:DNA-binding NarL/FixJ family response regulator